MQFSEFLFIISTLCICAKYCRHPAVKTFCVRSFLGLSIKILLLKHSHCLLAQQILTLLLLGWYNRQIFHAEWETVGIEWTYSGHKVDIQWTYTRVVHIIIIIVIIIIISFMQGIYTYIPETNYDPREYIVAATLLLLFMVLILLLSVLNQLYFYISTYPRMCAVPNMAVFCSSLTSCFLGMLLTNFLNDFEIVPVANILLVSPLFLHSTCAVLLFQSLNLLLLFLVIGYSLY